MAKNKLLLIPVVIVVIIIIIIIVFAATGNRPKCIANADLGYPNDNRGWYKHKHPWKKNTFCRDVGVAWSPDLVCNTDDKNKYVVASTIGISSADKHDRISAKNLLPSVC